MTASNQAEFIASLARDGFAAPVRVEREALGSLEEHSHPYEAKALVVQGELSIRTATGERVYRTGDVFHLARDLSHVEQYGPAGVTYLVGRKH